MTGSAASPCCGQILLLLGFHVSHRCHRHPLYLMLTMIPALLNILDILKILRTEVKPCVTL